MTDTENHAGQAMAAKEAQLMDEKGLARHGHQGFGNALRDGMQACCQSPGENGDREVEGWILTLQGSSSIWMSLYQISAFAPP